MSQQKGIINKKKPNYIAGLKAISNWTFGKQRKREDLEYIIKRFNIDNAIIKRFLLYIYNSPHIVWYMNKYLNHLYDFNKFETVDLIFSLTYLLDINRISKKSIPEKLMYLKNTELADKNKQKIKKLLEEYFSKIYDKEYNDKELNFFYDLVNLNIISFNEISEIDKHINSGKTTITLDNNFLPNSPKVNTEVMDIYKELSPEIKEYCESAKQIILNRPECKGCELFGKPTVILDTNMKEPGNVDVIFLGLNPGVEEVKIGKTAVGKTGKILRTEMSLLPPNIKWVITNILWCHTKVESEIKNFEDTKNRCKELVEILLSSFPSKIIVPMGAKAASWFNIKGGAGKVFTNNKDQLIIPTIHPSAANYNPANLTKFKTEFALVLENLLPQKPITTNISIPKSKKSQEISLPTTDKLITTLTEDLTFFDVREIDNKILTIYIDQNGQKKYKLSDYNMHFYIKNDSWKKCDQVTNKVDGIVHITGREKYQAVKYVRGELNNIKELKEN